MPNGPVLWQLQVSHYNEKARWALDYKRIPHTRRSLLPGPHVIVAKRLTGDIETTPVLTIDGRSIGDSTRIIAALEERWPEPPLYPQDDALRARALELEDFFDEELGPDIRRAVYQELLPRPDLVRPLFEHDQPLAARAVLRASWPVLLRGMRSSMDINPEAAERSRAKTEAAIDRLEQELSPSGYLVGDAFTVADLTAASLLYPIALPPEFPYPMVPDIPDSAREFVMTLRERPGGQWVSEMYRRHRQPVGVPVSR
jgi:glutathione S-transferase